MQVSTVNFAADVPPNQGVTSKAAVKAEPQPQEVKIEVKTESSEIAELRTELARHDISLRFSRDDATDQVVVQMIDGKTGDAIRQFPTEVSLSLAANFMKLQGVFIDVER
jgi:uncharacterized FlaG/YvyC family protein